MRTGARLGFDTASFWAFFHPGTRDRNPTAALARRTGGKRGTAPSAVKVAPQVIYATFKLTREATSKRAQLRLAEFARRGLRPSPAPLGMCLNRYIGAFCQLTCGFAESFRSLPSLKLYTCTFRSLVIL